MTFEQQHRRIETAIMQLLLSVLPEGWWAIQLSVTHERTNGVDAFPMEISNVDGPSKMVVPPEELFGLVVQSHRLFVENRSAWKRVSYRAWFDEVTEDWQFKIHYDYEDEGGSG